MSEATVLERWVEVASKRLAPKGHASFVHRIERLPDLLAALQGKLGSVQVLPLAARPGRAAHLVLVRARKGGRAAFRLHSPLIVHQGDHHQEDKESYTPLLRDVLRRGAEISFER